MQQAPSIRVYANGRQFIVVPLVTGADGQPVEAAPVRPVHLTMGRPVALKLTQAIRETQAASRTAGKVLPWDGEGGRWWAHHLLRLTITWEPDRIEITSGPQAKTDAGVSAEDKASEHFVLPADTPASDIAEWLIRHLGDRLHGS